MNLLNIMDTRYLSHEYKFLWNIYDFTKTPVLICGHNFNPIPGKEDTSFYLRLDLIEGESTPGQSRFQLYLKNVCLSEEHDNESGRLWVSSDVKLSGTSENILKAKITGHWICDGYIGLLMETVINAGYKKDVGTALNLEDDKLVIQGSLFFFSHHSSMDNSTQNCISELITDFRSMYKNGVSCNVTFSVGGSSLGAHKAVLCGRSSVFANMFQVDMQERNSNKIVIEDVEPHVFDQFLLFLYSGELENKNWGTILCLYSLAHKYDVKSLRKMCSKILGENLTSDIACKVLLLADLYSDKYLKGEVKKFMVKSMEIFATKEWAEIIANKPQLAKSIIVDSI